jgi:hypothetical protein
MKAHYKTANGRLTFEIENESQKGIFEGIASLQEVFEADSLCGACNSPHIRFRVRNVQKGTKTFKFYEMVCQACYAKLCFGQSVDTITLFPKRKTSDNTSYLPNRGWAKYSPNQEDDL